MVATATGDLPPERIVETVCIVANMMSIAQAHTPAAEALGDYREELNRWLDEHAEHAHTRRVLEPQDDAAVAHWRAWQARLADAGYVGVTWPEEFGGPGGTAAQQVVVDEELEKRRISGPFDFVGVGMIGPTLLVHGTPEQKERYLKPLLRAEETWCQLLSEPGAGSDLAAVSTKAQPQADGSWRVDGQKVWTSFAQHAAFGIMLARTDPDLAKHKGLTMFAVPMDAPGITIRPLRQITGDAEFNEVFLDDVRLDDSLRIGGRGEGWRVAVTMLSFERLTVGAGHLAAPVEDLVATVKPALGGADDALLRTRLGQVASELLAMGAMSERLRQEISTGRVPGPEAGLVKISSVSASLAACRLAVDAAGLDALTDPAWGSQVSALPGVRSAGGTEEILRNQIGERTLGLPAEPRVA
jgi:alkylation response protein AidB-like acyl-CoA dehydrogenase